MLRKKAVPGGSFSPKFPRSHWGSQQESNVCIPGSVYLSFRSKPGLPLSLFAEKTLQSVDRWEEEIQRKKYTGILAR